jgi:hypothetical protein
MGNTTSWQEVRRQRNLNEEDVTAYGWLIDAEGELEDLRHRRARRAGVVARSIDVELVDPDHDARADIYMTSVVRYVTALGGRVEVRAVFPDETVVLLRVPEPEEPASI